MDELYGDWTWVAAPTKKAHSTNTGAENNKQDRTEILWVNYELSFPQSSRPFSAGKEALPDEWFLDTYQKMVLKEPESAVNQPLKESFLTLRRQVEYDAHR